MRRALGDEGTFEVAARPYTVALHADKAIGETVTGYEATAWFGIGMPKGTPREFVDKINAEVNRALAAGASVEDVIGVLRSVTTVVGSARAMAAAPRIALALGYDVETEMELLSPFDEDGPRRPCGPARSAAGRSRARARPSSRTWRGAAGRGFSCGAGRLIEGWGRSILRR